MSWKTKRFEFLPLRRVAKTNQLILNKAQAVAEFADKRFGYESTKIKTCPALMYGKRVNCDNNTRNTNDTASPSASSYAYSRVRCRRPAAIQQRERVTCSSLSTLFDLLKSYASKKQYQAVVIIVGNNGPAECSYLNNNLICQDNMYVLFPLEWNSNVIIRCHVENNNEDTYNL